MRIADGHVAAIVITASLFAQGDASFTPARRLLGSLPQVPPLAVVGWMEETLELTVDATGRVAGVTLLRSTSTTSLVAPALGDWLFRAARNGATPVASHVLVAAMIRPPSLYDAPPPPAVPIDRAKPSGEIPFPVVSARPAYPPLAIADAMVLVEVLVGPDGRVRTAEIVDGAPGFEEASLAAARGWSFQPAKRNGHPVSALAYLLFGFRRPRQG